MDILKKKKSLGEFIAQMHNFQNIVSINKAFNKYINMDIHSILSKKEKRGW